MFHLFFLEFGMQRYFNPGTASHPHQMEFIQGHPFSCYKNNEKLQSLQQMKKDIAASLNSWQALRQQLRCFSIISFVCLRNGSVNTV